MTARIKEALQRLSGFTIGLFSVSWTPPAPERAVAHKVISYLGDRRTLYYSTRFEYPDQCVDSVLKIREHLTGALGERPGETIINQQVSGMLAECRQFLDTCQQGDLGVSDIRKYPTSSKHWEFIEALSLLRRGFGFRLAALSGAYDIELPTELQKILPPKANDA